MELKKDMLQHVNFDNEIPMAKYPGLQFKCGRVFATFCSNMVTRAGNAQDMLCKICNERMHNKTKRKKRGVPKRMKL